MVNEEKDILKMVQDVNGEGLNILELDAEPRNRRQLSASKDQYKPSIIYKGEGGVPIDLFHTHESGVTREQANASFDYWYENVGATQDEFSKEALKYIWEKAGSPFVADWHIMPDEDVQKGFGEKGVDWHRAHSFNLSGGEGWTDSDVENHPDGIYNIKDVGKFVAELAHTIQYKDQGKFGTWAHDKLRGLDKVAFGGRGYDGTYLNLPGKKFDIVSREHKTHGSPSYRGYEQELWESLIRHRNQENMPDLKN